MPPIRRYANLASLLLLGSLLVAPSASAEGAPPNDDIANATQIDAIPFETQGDMTGATLQADEPTDCDDGGLKGTVWFAYHASESAYLVATMQGLGGEGTLMAFEGDDPDSLREIGCQDFREENIVSMPVVAGRPYRIAVGRYGDGASDFRLRLEPDTLGKIEGRVTGAGEPLPAACAYASSLPINETGPPEVWRTARTEADGTYRIGGLPTGEYQLGFYDCSGAHRFLDEYYDDATWDTATPVHVDVGLVTSGVDADLALGGSISGRVTDEAGLPLANICVASDWDPDVYTLTRPDGTYSLTGFPTGEYSLVFGNDHCGEGEDRDYVPEWWDDAADEASATQLSLVAGEERTGIDAVLILGGWISGTVADADGTPVGADVCVMVVGSSRKMYTLTDAGGSYQIGGLGSGSYKVAFEPQNCDAGSSFLEEWWDDRPDEASAHAVEVVAGQGTLGIGAILHPGGSIAGHVSNTRGEHLHQVLVTAWRDGTSWAGSTRSGADGSYRLPGLPPGSYEIEFRGTPGGYRTEWYDDASSQAQATSVPVALDEEVTGIDAELIDAAVLLTHTSGSTAVAEAGGSDSYRVRLDRAPASDVTVAIEAGEQLSVAPSVLTFTAANWSSNQTVTVRAINDGIAEGSHTATVQHLVTSQDQRFHDLPVAPLPVTIADNDTAGVRLLESEGSTSVGESGGWDGYSIVLTSEPTADVTVQVLPDDQLSVDRTSVTLSPAFWAFGQGIRVDAVDDALIEGPHDGTISHVVRSDDPSYDGIVVEDLHASIDDDDATPTRVTLLGPSSAPLDSIVRFAGRLEGAEDASAMPGKAVRFELSAGGPVLRSITGLTDPGGVAEVDMDLGGLPRMDYVMRLSFAGDPLTLPTQATAPFTITRKPTSITLDAPPTGRTLDPIDVSATLVGATGSPLVGQEVAFRLVDGAKEVQEVRATTQADGIATATLEPIASGDLLVRASFPGSDTWMPSDASLPIMIQRREPALELAPVSVIYEADPSADVRLRDAENGRPIDFTDLSYTLEEGESVIRTGTVTTDSAGRARIPVSAGLHPGDYRLTVGFAGTKIWLPAERTTAVSIARRPIQVGAYQGPSFGTRGSTVMLRAQVIDGVTGSPRAGLALDFGLDAVVRSSSTDANGWAEVSMPLTHEPGSYTLTIDLPEGPLFASTPRSIPFQVSWEHTFTSGLGGATVFLNPSTQELRFREPAGTQAAIKKDAAMQTQTLPNGERAVIVSFMDAELQLRGAFHLERNAFVALAMFGGGVYPMAKLP